MDMERDVEHFFTQRCKRLGMLTFKLTSPGQAGVPDRLVLTGREPRVAFVEFKKEGERPRPLQRVIFTRIASRGVPVYVVDNKDTAERLIYKLWRGEAIR